MTDERKRTIYTACCGKNCPQYEPCAHMNPDGKCQLEEPWLDCDDFMWDHDDEITEAEDRIAEEEYGDEDEDEEGWDEDEDK